MHKTIFNLLFPLDTIIRREAVQTFVTANPSADAKASFAYESWQPWRQLHAEGSVTMGLNFCGRGRQSRSLPEGLTELIATREWVEPEFDLTKITRMSASKASLDQHPDLLALGQAYCRYKGAQVTPEALTQMLRHGQIRLVHQPLSEPVITRDWQTGADLANSGGSHHLAAAIWLASELKKPLKFPVQRQHHAFSQPALRTFCANYAAFVVRSNTVLFRELNKRKVSFWQASMTGITQDFTCHKYTLILLPRKGQRRIVARFSRADAFNFTGYLSQFRQRQ